MNFVSKRYAVTAVQFLVGEPWPPGVRERDIGFHHCEYIVDECRSVMSGDWIVRWNCGHLQIWRDQDFRASFEPAGGEWVKDDAPTSPGGHDRWEDIV